MAILDAIDRGIDSAPKIMIEAGIEKSQFHDITRSFIDSDLITREKRGFPAVAVYSITPQGKEFLSKNSVSPDLLDAHRGAYMRNRTTGKVIAPGQTRLPVPASDTLSLSLTDRKKTEVEDRSRVSEAGTGLLEKLEGPEVTDSNGVVWKHYTLEESQRVRVRRMAWSGSKVAERLLAEPVLDLKAARKLWEGWEMRFKDEDSDFDAVLKPNPVKW